MGCAGGKSSAKEAPIQNQRRRLSIGHDAGLGEGETVAEVSEEDRGFLTALNEQNIMDLLNSQGESDRKFSIGSSTDQGTTSFANKKVQQMGDKVDPSAMGIGFTCRKGLKPESPNQDSWCVLKVDSRFSIYAVFDGHGKQGHHVSNFVKENMPKMVLRDSRWKTEEMPKMLVDTFKKTQTIVSQADRLQKLNAQLSGTTATVCVHDTENKKLTIAHVADSTCVVGYLDAKGKLVGEALTRDHKPDLKDEKKRIEANGGTVVFDGYANHRVFAKGKRHPGLNMSRCIGDLLGHQDCGITAEPETLERPVTDQDQVLLLCSDGVWEFINPTEAVEMVCKFKPETAMNAADSLAKEAWDRWIQEEGGSVVDDITVVCVFLNGGKK
eukprot:CAMPEP_0178405286 /NCGR_PEP_ID=MMETSP0689_2-20121128/18321_1 /TAXON_ID=160604 /ORGANISM="Amphidinium massartii, Strain CS-259" /LENGTH=382 /DNA_ID=CAMNT_0020026297 /DNA_START=29 /DNA_END=1177 /DNA_ORIENTATION=+